MKNCSPSGFLLQIFLIKLWIVPSYRSFVCALTLSGYTSFMFGWHVHEKAIMLVLVPFRYVGLVGTGNRKFLIALRSLIAAENHAHFRTFVIASVAGIFSLFPLIFTTAGKAVSLG